MLDVGEEAGADAVEVKRVFVCFFGEHRVEDFDSTEFLECEVLCAANPFADFVEVFFGVDAWDNGGAEFIVGTTLHDDADALLKASDINIGITGSKRIFLRRVFDIHRPEVHEFGLGYFPDNVGEGAVGVEFHKESE